MDEYIIYLEGDVVGKSTKEQGHKKIVVNLKPTTVESGTYSGKLKLNVDKTGRITYIEKIEETDPLSVVTSLNGILYVEDGKIKSIDKADLTPEQTPVEYPVTSVNGQKGDVVIEIPAFKQTYKKGDYSINQISGVSLGKGVLKSDGEKIFSVEETEEQPVTLTIDGDVEGSGVIGKEKIKLNLNTVPVSKGGTGAKTKKEAILNLWPGEDNCIVIKTKEGFSSVKNEEARGFLIQESDGLPSFGKISAADLPSMSFALFSDILPVSKGGLGTIFQEEGFVYHDNGQMMIMPATKESLDSLFAKVEELTKKVKTLEEYTTNIELTLRDEIRKGRF